MKRSQPPNPFELENLEPRIMLSGDLLVGIVDALAPDRQDPLEAEPDLPPKEETTIPGEGDAPIAPYDQSLAYDPSQNLTDIFSGLDAGVGSGETAGDTATETGDAASLADHILTASEKAALMEGVAELVDLGRRIERSGAFAAALPLTDGETFGRLLGPHEILDTRLAKPVYKYFSDATDPPTTDGLVAALHNLPDLPDQEVAVNEISGGYDANSGEIRFSVDLQASRNGDVRLDTGLLADRFGLRLAQEPEVDYLAVINLDFMFGLAPLDGADEFFIAVDDFTAALAIDTDLQPETAAAETAAGTFRIVAGTVDLSAEVSVTFDDTIAGDGRITLAELRVITPETFDTWIHMAAAGTLLVDLTLTAESGENQTETIGPEIHIDVTSGDLFATDTPPELSFRVDISSLQDSLLDLLSRLRQAGEGAAAVDPVNATLAVLYTSIRQILADNPRAGLAQSGQVSVFDLYTPTLAYFILVEIFNLNIEDCQSAIGALPGIDLPDFDIGSDSHRLKLKHLIENEFELTLASDWDFSLYLPEIWSLLNPDFQVNDHLPDFQVLLGLPYVPTLNQVRSDIKSYFGSFPSLQGLVDYVAATRLNTVFTGFSGRLSSEPFLPGVASEASLAAQVNETVDGLVLNVEELPDQLFGASGDRFDFDARAEQVFHGLDPPADVDACNPLTALNPESNVREIVFIDSRVPGYQTLVNHFLATQSDNSAIEILILDSDRDGIEQISAVLPSFGNLSAIHIISHGSPGSLELGTARLDSTSLNQYAARLETWGESLTAGEDILLYGCNIAKGETGVEFVERLSNLTHTDVAASTNDTGSAALGGDWSLEYTTGVIEVSTVTFDYAGLLDKTTINGTNNPDTFTIVKDGVNGDTEHDEFEVNGKKGDDIFKFTEAWQGEASKLHLDGGDDNDTIDLAKVNEKLTIKLKSNGDIDELVVGNKTFKKVKNIEVIKGGKKDTTLDMSAYNVDLKFTIHESGVVVKNGDTVVIEVSGVTHIKSGNGNDTFVFEKGANLKGTIDGGGGPGINTLDYKAFKGKVKVDLTTANQSGFFPSSLPKKGVKNIQHIIGGQGNSGVFASKSGNDLTGDAFGNELTGGKKKDQLKGGAGNDTLVGKKGDDTLTGGPGADTLTGGEGNDIYKYKITDIGDPTKVENRDTVVELNGAEEGKADKLDFSAIPGTSNDKDVSLDVHVKDLESSGVTVNLKVGRKWGTLFDAAVKNVEKVAPVRGVNTFKFHDKWSKGGTVFHIEKNKNPANNYRVNLDFSIVTHDLLFEIEKDGRVTVYEASPHPEKGLQASKDGAKAIAEGVHNLTGAWATTPTNSKKVAD